MALALNDGCTQIVEMGMVPVETPLTIWAATTANMTQAVQEGFSQVRPSARSHGKGIQARPVFMCIMPSVTQIAVQASAVESLGLCRPSIGPELI